MKISIWDILSVVTLLAIVGLLLFFLAIFVNPDSPLNMFRAPALPATIVIPSATPPNPTLPPTWTSTGPAISETPNELTQTAIATMATAYEGEVVISGTVYTFPTFTPTVTPTPTSTLTPTKGPTSPTSTKAPSKTAGPSPTKAPTATATNPANVSTVTEKSGIKSDVWQKTNNRPTFKWTVTKDMFEFTWYFGPDKEGTSNTRVAIRHDSNYVEFTPPSTPLAHCGAYYFRLKIKYAIPAKPGGVVKYMESDWKTVFIFKYDNDPPRAPYYVSPGIKGATRGIQNISPDPSFNLSWVDGVILGAGTYVIVSGDYIGWDVDLNGELDPYMCSGTKGYYVYWGPDPNGIDKSNFVKSPIYNPRKITPNTSYFLRVQTVDNMDNVSDWRTVALDEDYDVTTGVLPTVEQAVFYYDTVKPNNLGAITVNNGVISNGPFTNDDGPTFSFTGGEDPVGFRTTPMWGYHIAFSTDPNAKHNFVPYDVGGNTYSPNIGKSGTYFLRVRAVDWAGNASLEWSTFVYRFDDVGPAGVTKVTEATGAPSNVFQNTFNDPYFSWTGPVTDPGDSKTSSGPRVEYWVYWGTDPDADPGSFTAQPGTTFDPAAVTTGEYYLRIMTMDNAGNQTITTPFVLKFDNTPPTNPTSAVEKGGARDGVAQKKVKAPKFTWNGAADDGSGIVGYYVYFGDDPNGTSTKLQKTASYSGKSAAAGVPYYLRVSTRDNAGNDSGVWDTIFTFIYDPTAP